MPNGFDVDLDALDQSAQAVAQTIHDTRTVAVEDIVGPASMYGHEGLRTGVKHFCDRWQEGVEILLEDSDKLVTALNGSVDAYTNADTAAERSMRAIGDGSDPARDVADG